MQLCSILRGDEDKETKGNNKILYYGFWYRLLDPSKRWYCLSTLGRK